MVCDASACVSRTEVEPLVKLRHIVIRDLQLNIVFVVRADNVNAAAVEVAEYFHD